MKNDKEISQDSPEKHTMKRQLNEEQLFLDKALIDAGIDDETFTCNKEQPLDITLRALHIEQGLDSLPLVNVSASLHKKLYAIPKRRNYKWILGASLPAAAIVMAFLIGPTIDQSSQSLLTRESVSLQDIERAKFELNIALSYLGSANQRSRDHVGQLVNTTIEKALKKSVSENTHI